MGGIPQVPERVIHDVYPGIDPQGRLRGSMQGLNVAVTGASRGCGRFMALAFAQAGASKLFLLGRDEARLLETAELVKKAGAEQALVYLVDMSRDDISGPFEQLLEDAGRVDVLVNNAGVLEDWKSINDSDPDVWKHTWTVNVLGTYLATKALLPSMLSQKGGGTIINITSVGGLVTRPGASAYQSSKTQVTRFTAFLDADHGSQGIRTFALEPGNVPTDLAKCMPEAMHSILVDTPELSGAVCVYLSTPEADYLRGRHLSANWDLMELQKCKDEILEKDLLKLQLAV